MSYIFHNGSRRTVWKIYQQGDSFDIPMLHKVNDQVVDIDEGYTIGVGFFNDFGRALYIAKVGDGIRRVDVGTYLVSVTHEASANMVGYVTLEFVIYDTDGRIVDHSDNMATVYFEPRQMNKNI